MPGIPTPIFPDSFKKRKFPFLSKKVKWMLPILIMSIGVLIFFVFYPINLKKTNSLKKIVRLRYELPAFIGRETYLDQLYKDFCYWKKQKHPPSLIKVLWGNGGIGKTEIALAFANRHLKEFALSWTIKADCQENIDMDYRLLADQLGVYTFQESADQVRERVHFELENRPSCFPWLIIYDSLEQELNYPQRGGMVLITSQKKVSESENIIEICPFSTEESILLLEKLTQEKRGEKMKRLASDLGEIPLFLSTVAHYIRTTPGASIEDYTFLDVDMNNFFSILQFPLKSLEKENPKALEWFYLSAYLHPQSIPEDWIDSWLGNIRYPIIERRKILKSLKDYGLIQYSKETQSISIHSLIHKMVREYRKNEWYEDLKQSIDVVKKNATDYHNKNKNSWEKGEQWNIHACQVAGWIEKNPSPSFKIDLALLYEYMAEWSIFNDRGKEALSLNLKVLNIREKVFEKTSIEIARAYGCLGWNYFKLNQFEQSIEACNQALWIVAMHHKNSVERALFLATRGLALTAQKKYQEALEDQELSLQIRQNNYGENHFQVGRSFYLTAVLYRKLGQLNIAHERNEKAKKILLITCGEEHSWIYWSMHNEAKILSMQGKHVKALELFQKALSGYKRLKKGPHYLAAYCLNGIGQSYLSLGKPKRAAIYFQKAKDTCLKYPDGCATALNTAQNGLDSCL